MALNDEVRSRIASIVSDGDKPVVLFMKGDRRFPQCGFSARVVQVLDGLLPEYQTVDVLAEPEIREAIKEFSNWPTIPQLYVRGEFLGGCDIINEMFESGDLHKALGVPVPEAVVPDVEISDAAAERIREHAQRTAGGDLHLGIDARFQASLGFGAQQPGEIVVESNGVKLWMDPLTANRASGVKIDVAETPTGSTLKIDIPAARNAA